MPGQDANAPNLQIAVMTETLDAIGLAPGFRERLGAMHENISKQWSELGRDCRRRLGRAINSPAQLLARINELSSASAADVAGAAQRLRSTAFAVRGLTNRHLERLRRKHSVRPPESDARRRLDSQIAEIQRLSFAIARVVTFVKSPSWDVMAKNRLLVLGRWGTGKTHSLCDLASRRMADRLPTLLCLGQQIPEGEEPLAGLCRITGLAPNPESLLRELQRLGSRAGCRSLLIVDAINEGDRRAWRQALRGMRQRLTPYPNVALVLSCRQPFDEQMVSRKTVSQFAIVSHEGFAEQEFNAQLSFFDYYRIPAPQFPLITHEFSRPLFLKLLCESVQHLSRGQQHRQLKTFASGQRGMTFLLERFVKTVGSEIESDFQLDIGTCWRILKGDAPTRGSAIVGIAPAMAEIPSDVLSPARALDAIQPFIGGQRRRSVAQAVLRRMISDGLLSEDIRWTRSGPGTVVRFPYQRFGDHIIARHLLARHLRTDSETAIRRSFYRTRMLGRIFELGPGGYSYRMPGLASALMVEFPERVRRRLPEDERELVFYLPKDRQLVEPLRDAFLESLPWRTNESFSKQTAHVVNVLLKPQPPRSPNAVIEVLLGLSTREGHVYSAEKLQQWLARMSMPDRDLLWSEYIRTADDTSTIFRLIEWIERNSRERMTSEAAETSTRLLSVMLTTTVRPFRDRVTRALFLIGLEHPKVLFGRTVEMLSFNDPYVRERLLAACYGVAMALWADPYGQQLRAALPELGRALLQQMFVPPAPVGTRHSLARNYALGAIELATRVDPTTVSRYQRRFLRPPFDQLSTPFDPNGALTDDQRREAAGAIHMDFGNYTLGTLVPGRQNYDDSNADYQVVKRQILGRIQQLGYSSSRFGDIDRFIASYGGYDREQSGSKTDRYGKKYSWIAFFELTGLRADRGLLHADWHNPLRTDVDIDPSFPHEASKWKTSLANPFSAAPTTPVEWLHSGPIPGYDFLLDRATVDGLRGPWVLLDGYVSEESDPRRVFTFFQGMMVESSRVETLESGFKAIQYPGNHAIPRPGEDHYTYGGEIPWSVQFGSSLRRRDGSARRNRQRAFGQWSKGRERGGVLVEVPAHQFSWSPNYSILNKDTGAHLPAPAVCQALGLVNHARTLDLYSSNGRRASLFRAVIPKKGLGRGSLLYIRKSLLVRYLRSTNQKFVWMIWGERGFTTGSGLHESAAVQSAWGSYRHIHRRFRTL